MKMNRALKVRQYMGDDEYSWAVFYKNDLNKFGIPTVGPVPFNVARPIVSGLSKSEALHYKRQLEKSGNRGRSKEKVNRGRSLIHKNDRRR